MFNLAWTLYFEDYCILKNIILLTSIILSVVKAAWILFILLLLSNQGAHLYFQCVLLRRHGLEPRCVLWVVYHTQDNEEWSVSCQYIDGTEEMWGTCEWDMCTHTHTHNSLQYNWYVCWCMCIAVGQYLMSLSCYFQCFINYTCPPEWCGTWSAVLLQWVWPTLWAGIIMVPSRNPLSE